MLPLKHPHYRPVRLKHVRFVTPQYQDHLCDNDQFLRFPNESFSVELHVRETSSIHKIKYRSHFVPICPSLFIMYRPYKLSLPSVANYYLTFSILHTNRSFILQPWFILPSHASSTFGLISFHVRWSFYVAVSRMPNFQQGNWSQFILARKISCTKNS